MDLHLQRPFVIPSQISSVIIPLCPPGHPVVTWPSHCFHSEWDEARREGDQRAQHTENTAPKPSRVLCLLILTNPDVAVGVEPRCAQQLSVTVLAAVYSLELRRDRSEECSLNEDCILSGCFGLESKASGNKARHRMEKNFSEGCID